MFLLLALAVLQGLTEFLPVSSSGHLVLARELFGDDGLPKGATVEVALHLGTLAAVLVWYRAELFQLLVTERRRLALVALACVPLVPVGIWHTQIEATLFGSPAVAAAGLLVTGVLLLASARLPAGGSELAGLAWKGALLIGCVQALAVIPGISRSGATIVAGMALGMRAEAATTFSFLIAVPAMAAAGLLTFLEVAADGAPRDFSGLVLAAALASAVGLVALAILVKLARARRLSWFAPYCFAAGALGLLLLNLR
ncbi:MAG TPA: undecaprenyl-diphosphate phosphatase [Planctomycetota bacterium]